MRTDLTELLSLAKRLLDHNEPGTLATLLASHGSSYRSLGAMMVAGPPGTTAGGVSGGCLEEYIARHGREMTRDRDAVLMSFDTGTADDIDDPKPVLGCGGSIEVLVERLTPKHLDHLQRLSTAYDSDIASLTTCVVEPAANDAVTVTRTWGRPEGHDPLASIARQALCDRRSYCAKAGDAGRALVHYVPPLTRLVVFGAGDDARPVCDLARSLGWHVTVADRRARKARADLFPAADVVLAEPWTQAVKQIRFTTSTAIVIMTHSLIDDVELLPLLADKPFAYAGVLGPTHRRDALLSLANENGALGEDFIARLRGPIGLDLGDRSAAGIAVAVIAEIVASLNDRAARPMSTPIDASLSPVHAR